MEGDCYLLVPFFSKESAEAFIKKTGCKGRIVSKDALCVEEEQ